ncbi:MAG: hypothetical protein HKN18_00605 [Silicimonas sp.]|nr:hypothetical protein [Silicimonas sp.]
MVSISDSAEASRLVLTFANRPGWSAVESDAGFTVSLGAPGYEIDLSGIEQGSQNTRIQTIAHTEDGILVAMACDCDATAYEFGAGSLIVEVRERAPSVSVGEAPNRPPLLATDAPTWTAPALNDVVIDRAPPDPPPGPDRKVAREGTRERLPWLTDTPTNALIEELGFVDLGATSDHSVDFIGREFSRAASQGMVDADPMSRRSPHSSGAVDTADLEGRTNLSIITAFDRGFVVPRDEVSATHEGSVCFSNSDVDLLSWGDTTDMRYLGKLRGAAVAEDGGISPDGARALARYYIALGFGSEAEIAAGAMDDERSGALLLAMAQIMDHGFSQSSILQGQILCDGKVALWAALAGPIDPSYIPTSTEEILSTFSALPPHLRAHLGPLLAERLRAVGLEDDARRAVNAVARGGLQSNESELVAARLRLAGTRHNEARDVLSDLSNGTDVTAAEALLELLEDAERRGMAPNPAWVEDAPSLTRATEGTDVAVELNLAGLRGRIVLGQFDELRNALSLSSPGLNDQTRGALSASALIAAAEVAEDVAFIKSEIGFSKLVDVQSMTRDGRYAVALRLLSLGLAERAKAYLPDVPASPIERTATAEVLFATGRTGEAITLLAGRLEPEAAEKLGMIYARDGQDGLAVNAFEGGGHLDQAAKAAIRAGEWNWIAARELEGASGQLSEAMRGLLAEQDDQNASNGPENGALVRASQVRRSQIRALLAETELTDVPVPFTN